jgi:hypothetical protein
MVEFALLGSMRRREAARATTPLMMTMLPGSAPQRSALAAVAVTTQVQDGLRRERRVATSAAKAVLEAVKSPTGSLDITQLSTIPGLGDIATAALLQVVNGVAADPAIRTVTPPDPLVLVKQAFALVDEVAKSRKKLSQAAAKKKYPELVAAAAQAKTDLTTYVK